MLDIFEIWISIFLNSPGCQKRPELSVNDGDGDNKKTYNDITDNYYPLVHVIIRLDGSLWYFILGKIRIYEERSAEIREGKSEKEI